MVQCRILQYSFAGSCIDMQRLSTVINGFGKKHGKGWLLVRTFFGIIKAPKIV
jgi:hypothetical protein